MRLDRGEHDGGGLLDGGDLGVVHAHDLHEGGARVEALGRGLGGVGDDLGGVDDDGLGRSGHGGGVLAGGGVGVLGGADLDAGGLERGLHSGEFGEDRGEHGGVLLLVGLDLRAFLGGLLDCSLLCLALDGRGDGRAQRGTQGGLRLGAHLLEQGRVGLGEHGARRRVGDHDRCALGVESRGTLVIGGGDQRGRVRGSLAGEHGEGCEEEVASLHGGGGPGPGLACGAGVRVRVESCAPARRSPRARRGHEGEVVVPDVPLDDLIRHAEVHAVAALLVGAKPEGQVAHAGLEELLCGTGVDDDANLQRGRFALDQRVLAPSLEHRTLDGLAVRVIEFGRVVGGEGDLAVPVPRPAARGEAQALKRRQGRG